MKGILNKLPAALFLFIAIFAKAQEQKPFVNNNNQFAFELYQNLNTQYSKKNLFFSPYSISEALAMVYQGAEGTTCNQMQQVFHFNTDKVTLHKGFAENRQLLSNRLDSVTLTVANSFWLQKGYPLIPEFTQTAQNYYGAPVAEVNYLKKRTRKKAVGVINNWVCENTRQQIKSIVAPADVSEETRLILVNAIYFYGAWQKAFIAEKSHEGVFYGVLGDQQAVFMNQTGKYAYYTDDMIQAIQLPYAGNNQSMVILLPADAEAMDHLNKNMEPDYLSTIINDMAEEQVMISIPRFSAEFSANLAEVLYAMGMQDAFTDNANFKGLVANNELKVDKVLHKARVRVTEQGAEAAAATAVIMVRKTAYIQQLEFVANRPFVYFIRDNATGTILFMGRLNMVD